MSTESIVDVNQIVKIVNKTEINNKNWENIEKLLQVTTGRNLFNDVLKNSRTRTWGAKWSCNGFV